jgi:VWFA-related protein
VRSLLLVLVFTAVCAAQAPDAGLFRARTDLVALDVAVKDHAGRFVERLAAQDFVVLEDDVPQQVLFFSPAGRLPLAVVLLVDDSQSMYGEPLARAKAAASSFLSRLQPDDRVEVLAFNDHPIRLYPMGADHAAAARAVQSLESRGMTRLYDAILVAQRDLEQVAHESRRPYQKSIVILSDGEDTKSALSFDDVLDDARRNTTAVNAISVRTDVKRRWLPPVRELTQLSSDTGGQTIAIRKMSDIEAAYECIGSDLRAQYRLGYVSSSPGKEGWRRVSVRVKDQDVIARTRAGYFAPPAAAAAGVN